MSKFEYIINRIASRHGVHSLFSDLLDLLIYAFSAGRKEKEYYELIHKYEKPEAYTISEAMAALIIEMTGENRSGNGYTLDSKTILTWKTFHRSLQVIKVDIPFAPAISSFLIKKKNPIAARRAYTKVLSVIQSIACTY